MQGSPPCEICTAVSRVVAATCKYCVLTCATTCQCMQIFYQNHSCTLTHVGTHTHTHTHNITYTHKHGGIQQHWEALSLHHVVKRLKLDWLVLCTIPCQYNWITHLILPSSIYITQADTPFECTHVHTHAHHILLIVTTPLFLSSVLAWFRCFFVTQSALCAALLLAQWPFFQPRLWWPMASEEIKTW